MDPSRFLDAVDQVLNSNTFLLRLPRDGIDDVAAVVHALEDPGFRRALMDADRERDWDLFHTWGPEGREPTELPLTRHCTPAVSPLSPTQVRSRLVGMLVGDGFRSPYHRERSPSEAKDLVDALLHHVGDTRAYDVDPSLLFAHGEEGAGYRDGMGSDTVTAFLDAQWVWFLLTNGMP